MAKRTSKKNTAPGKELSPEEWKLKLENYCAYRERCEQEVRQKMYEWRVPEADRDAYIRYLAEEGFLNDDRYVTAFARGKFRIKHWGRNKILAELRARNIQENKARQSLSGIDEGEYFLALLDLLEKKDKILREPDTYIRKQKLFRFAVHKGYETELIREALEAMKS